MIELKKEFVRKGGREYRQLFKNDKFAAYECTQTFEDGSTSYWCEVFKMKVNKPNNIMPDYYEVYPSDEEFGVRAWCCTHYCQVERVFDDCLDECFPEYAEFFSKLRLETLKRIKPYNYEGT